MVGFAQLDMDLARRESPTTDRFYHVDQIVDSSFEEAEDFRENLLSRIGIRA
jgi:XcyI restriction endonuclease